MADNTTPRSGVARRPSLGLSALALLVLIDVAFLALDLHHNVISGPARSSLEVHRDRSIPEYFQYIKLLWVCCVLVLLAWSTRVRSLVVWLPLCGFLLATDLLRVHERLGGRLAQVLNLDTVVAGSGSDLGEMGVAAAVAGLTLIGLVVIWPASSTRLRVFHVGVGLLIGVLAGFGLLADLLHAAAGQAKAQGWLARLEDGGEMVAVSALLAFLIASVGSGASVAWPRRLTPPLLLRPARTSGADS